MVALSGVKRVPSVSKKQHNLMAMVANDPAAAKRVGIPKSVGEEYMQADKGKKVKGADRSRPDLQKVNKPTTRQGQGELFANGGAVRNFKSKGNTMPLTLKKKTQSDELDEKKKEAISDSMNMKKGGMATKKYAKGGFIAQSKMGGVKTAAPSRDGIATKGKTKGTMVKMAGAKNYKRGGAC